MTRRLVVIAASMVVLAGCTDWKARAASLERDKRQLDTQLAARRQAVKAAEEFARDLGRAGPPPAALVMAYSSDELVRRAAEALPLRINAREFHSKLKGTIVVERLVSLRFLPDNRAEGVLFLRGIDLTYTGKVPDAYRKPLADYLNALARGADVDLALQFTVVDGRLRVEGDATAMRLKQKVSGNYESMILGEMNERAFRRPLAFDLAIQKQPLRPAWVVLTRNHALVAYDRK